MFFVFLPPPFFFDKMLLLQDERRKRSLIEPAEEHEVTTFGKAILPCDGRNISARVCKAAFRQKLGSIAVREFRPVICNCRAAHYNSPFLVSVLSPLSPLLSPPRTLRNHRPFCHPLERLVSAGGAVEGSGICALVQSLCLFPRLFPLISRCSCARTKRTKTHFIHALLRDKEVNANKNVYF